MIWPWSRLRAQREEIRALRLKLDDARHAALTGERRCAEHAEPLLDLILREVRAGFIDFKTVIRLRVTDAAFRGTITRTPRDKGDYEILIHPDDFTEIEAGLGGPGKPARVTHLWGVPVEKEVGQASG